jgi:FixJ family two-component response regulator
MPEQSQKICVVDDDMSVLNALGRLLGSAGLQMLPFNDPRLFLEHARNNLVALAIIDVWMPQINGFEVQRLLLDMVAGQRIDVPPAICRVMLAAVRAKWRL